MVFALRLYGEECLHNPNRSLNMILFWKWKELYHGYSYAQFLAIRTTLAENNIRYSDRLKRRDASPPFRSSARNMLGRVGENPDVSTMYYIYVYKLDFENAEYMIRDAK